MHIYTYNINFSCPARSTSYTTLLNKPRHSPSAINLSVWCYLCPVLSISVSLCKPLWWIVWGSYLVSWAVRASKGTAHSWHPGHFKPTPVPGSGLEAPGPSECQTELTWGWLQWQLEQGVLFQLLLQCSLSSFVHVSTSTEIAITLHLAVKVCPIVGI